MDPLENAAALFKLLSHPSRLAILHLLRDGEECVCHIEAALGLRQAYISQQLMVLRQAGLVTDRRDGWNVFYRVAKPEVFALFDSALVTVGQDARASVPSRAEVCPAPSARLRSRYRFSAFFDTLTFRKMNVIAHLFNCDYPV